MSSGKRVLIAILAIPAIAILYFVTTWDANNFKGQASPHMENVQGHTIDFANIEHSLLSPGYVVIEGISVTGGIANGSIGTLELDASVMDAISKNLILREVVLRDTDLKIDMQALQAWQQAQGDKPQDEKSKSDEKTELPVQKIYVEALSLENVSVRDVSDLQQFLIAGLNLTLTDLRIAENAQLIIGQPEAPVEANLEIAQLEAMGSKLGKLSTQLNATEQMVKLDSLTLQNTLSLIDLHGSISNPQGNADIKLVLNDSLIAIDEYKALLPPPPIDATGTLKIKGKVDAQGALSDPQSIINNLVSDLSLVLDTGRSLLDASADITNLQGDTTLKLNIRDSNLNVDEFHALFKDIPVKPSGNIQLSGLLDAKGLLAEPESMLGTLTGNVELGLDQGKLLGIDINEIVTGFKESKEADFKDLGGYLLTGPVGILAANMFDLGAGAASMEGETLIPQLRIKGAMDQGTINLKDTALATDKYRLAFDGALNPTTKTFSDFTFALLDKSGCADIKQTLNGDMSKPTSAIANSLLDSAIAPLKGLFKALTTEKETCKPFYNGEVQDPNPV